MLRDGWWQVVKYRVTEPPAVLAVVRIKPSCWQPSLMGPPDNIGKNPLLPILPSRKRLHSIIPDCGNQLEPRILTFCVLCWFTSITIYDSVQGCLVGTTDIARTHKSWPTPFYSLLPDKRVDRGLRNGSFLGCPLDLSKR